MFEKRLALSFLLLASWPAVLLAQPGPPPPPPAPAGNAGNGVIAIQGLSAAETAFFNQGITRFTEVDSVTGTQPGATGTGLGPRFNLNSCAGCHAHPSIGGSSPAVNPQIAMATNYGATNTIPSFVTLNGPVRVARFLTNPDGTPDGSVHDLFVITGRADATGCRIAQPNFAAAEASGNLGMRIPTPLFGLGLVEAIEDATILAGESANAPQKTQLGIAGHANISANDGTITRFGWKAQNKSLQIFAGEAYNVEQGVTNELFPTEREETAGCQFNTTPEDYTNTAASSVLASISDVTGFMAFIRYLAPPPPPTVPPGATPASVANGQNVFTEIGCALCHTPTMQTGNSTTAALRNQPVHLYSDLLVHNMGSGLADGITQGTATGNDFRTAPLWGLGARLFYLHDGRTSDLTTAITAHASTGSEANAVVAAFEALPASTKQDVLNFLKSL